MKYLLLSFFFFISTFLYSQNEKFDTDSTKSSQYTYEGFIKSENTISKKFGFIDTLGTLKIPYIFDYVGSFSEGLAPTGLNENYGFINKKGEVVIPMIYKAVSQFVNGHAVVYNDFKSGLINTKNDTILPFDFAMLGGHPDNLIFVNSEDLKSYGVIKIDNTAILERQFSRIKKFRNKLLLTKKNNKWQVRNIEGKLLLDLFFDEVIEYKEEKLIRLKVNDRYGFIDELGDIIIPFEYEQFKGFSEGLVPCKQLNKWGFIDTSGKEIVGFKYDDAHVFINGSARIKTKDKYNLININDNFLLPNHEQIINRILGTSLMRIGKWDSIRIYNKDLKLVLPFYCGSVGSHSYNRISFKKDGKYGFIDSKGKIVINHKYEKVGSFSNGYSLVSSNGKKGIIDTLDNEIIPIIYDDFDWWRAEQGILKQGKKFGIFDKAEIVVPVIYDYLKGTQHDRYIYKKDNKFGLVDIQNKEILKNEFDQIIDAKYGYGCMVRKKNKWGFIQKDKDEISVPIIYDTLIVKANLIFTKKEGYHGVITDLNNTFIPFDYEKIEVVENGIIVEKNNKKGLYSYGGHLIFNTNYDDFNISKYPIITAINGDKRDTIDVSKL